MSFQGMLTKEMIWAEKSAPSSKYLWYLLFSKWTKKKNLDEGAGAFVGCISSSVESRDSAAQR